MALKINIMVLLGDINYILMQFKKESAFNSKQDSAIHRKCTKHKSREVGGRSKLNNFHADI